MYRHLGEGVVLTCEVDPLPTSGEYGTAQRRRFLKHVGAVLDRRQLNAEPLMIVGLPARTEAEHSPTAGDVIERERHVRHDAGMPVGVAADHQTEAQIRHRCGERSERDPPFEHGVHLGLGRTRTIVVVGRHHEVIGQPGATPACFGGPLGGRADVVERLGGRGPIRDVDVSVPLADRRCRSLRVPATGGSWHGTRSPRARRSSTRTGACRRTAPKSQCRRA